MTEPRIDSFVQLSDKRRLAYAEYGDPVGTAFFLFHGLPGSRLSWGFIPNQLPTNVRIIATDRPGYGRSDPKPGRTLIDWASDVSELADALKIEKFSILGVSGGGPGALACTWSFPERLIAVGIVSSAAPTNAPGVFQGMSMLNQFFMNLAWRWPWLSALNVRMLASVIQRNPARYINTMKAKMHGVDKAIIAKPEIQQMLVKDFAEALRGGAQGMVDDLSANHGRPWGFPLDKIKPKVQLWFCELDRSVPPAMGRYLGSTIPNCEATFVRGAGHMWILEHLNEVITSLKNHQQDANPPNPTLSKPA